MSTNAAVPSDETTDSSVMTALDGEGSEARVIVADLAREEAWLSMPLEAAADLDDWR